MRHKASSSETISLIMRDSAYSILDAISSEPKSWSELVKITGLTESGLLKLLKEM